MKYFFDTYAIIEFLDGNKKCFKAFKKGMITTRLNLMELYYQAFKKWGKIVANKLYAKFLEYVVDFDDNIIKEAMMFRLNMKKKGKDFSYTDCIGYTLAKKKKIKFLTGDEEFKGMVNVEFVK